MRTYNHIYIYTPSTQPLHSYTPCTLLHSMYIPSSILYTHHLHLIYIISTRQTDPYLQYTLLYKHMMHNKKAPHEYKYHLYLIYNISTI